MKKVSLFSGIDRVISEFPLYLFPSSAAICGKIHSGEVIIEGGLLPISTPAPKRSSSKYMTQPSPSPPDGR